MIHHLHSTTLCTHQRVRLLQLPIDVIFQTEETRPIREGSKHLTTVTLNWELKLIAITLRTYKNRRPYCNRIAKMPASNEVQTLRISKIIKKLVR